MDGTTATRDGGSITTRLQFTQPGGATPVALVKRPGFGRDMRSGAYVRHEVTVHDARPFADRLDIDRDGYAFRRYATAVDDFYDDDEVRRVYYPEMEALLKEVSGASKVVIFDHTQRIDDDAQQTARKLRPPATIVHNDFTEESVAQRVRDLLPADEAAARLAKRFGSINVWRPIRGPVQTAPLVICGYRDLRDDDLVVAERRYPDGRIGRIYNIVYNPAQRWYYFPNMERDEVVLLKCFDSLTDGTARWTAHGSFEDQDRPANAMPRESIEIRSLVFYD